MRKLQQMDSIRKTIAIGMSILIFGCLITIYLVTKYSDIGRNKKQVVSLIYYTDY